MKRRRQFLKRREDLTPMKSTTRTKKSRMTSKSTLIRLSSSLGLKLVAHPPKNKRRLKREDESRGLD